VKKLKFEERIRTVYLLILFVLFSLAVLSIFSSCTVRSGDEGRYLNMLSITVKENNIAEIRISHKNITIKNLYIILPFEITEHVSHHPSSVLLLWNNYQNKYCVISVLLPSGTTEFSIFLKTNKLVRIQGNLRKILINFSYESAPEVITQLIAKNNTYYFFKKVEVGLPGINSFCSETPSATSFSGTYRYYDMKDIEIKGDNRLVIVYSLTETFAWVELIASSALGVPSLISILLMSPSTVKRRRNLFVFLCIVLILALLFFTYNLLVFGITWDFLSKYYGGLLENSVVLLIKTSLCIRNKGN